MTQLTENAAGVFAIAATPFTASGALDLASTDRLVEFYLEKRVAGLTVLGMMGEAPKLAAQEATQFAEHILKRVAGRVPIVVGVSAPGFRAMGDLGRAVMDAGAAGLMIQPPATSARGDDAVLAYCRQTVAAIGDDTPWVLQDFPLASAVPMSAGLIARIMNEMPSCVMLKHEDWPGLDKLSALRGAQAPKRRISILTGNGGIFLPHELVRGADGAMTGFAYPEMLVAMCELHAKGARDDMLDLFDAYLPLVRYEQQPGLGLSARKYVLMKRGAITSDFVRPPGAKLSDTSIAEIELLMSRLDRRLSEIN